MTTVVLDLDGVVYRGDTPVPGAPAALRLLVDRHLVLLATNDSRRRPEDVAEKVARLTGVVIDPGAIVTSATAAARLARPVPTAVVGGEGIRAALAAAGVEVVADSDGAQQVVTGLDTDFDFARLRSVSDLLRAGAPWIATNTDATYPLDGGLMPGAGALVAALATASGREPVVAGKPHPPMVGALAALAGDGDVVVVGDRPETDLALAIEAGWRPVLVLSGVTDDPTTVPPACAPEVVLGSLADVPSWLEDGSPSGPSVA